MKMNEGDYIHKNDIPDEETFILIRIAVRGMGHRVLKEFGNWFSGNSDACLLLDSEGDLLWAQEGNGRRLFPANILGADEPQGHPAADLLAEIAEVARTHPEPWREFEYHRADGSWGSFDGMRHIASYVGIGAVIRRKPRTITINGHEVPEPVREPLNINQEYYSPSLIAAYGYAKKIWCGDGNDHYRLDAGLVHLTSEAADRHSTAMLSFTAL